MTATAHSSSAIRDRDRQIAARVFVCALALLGAASCSKPTIHGSVLPAASEQAGLPWKRVEVRLLSGELFEQLAELAAQRRQEAMLRALDRARASLTDERDTKAAALRKASDALTAIKRKDPDESASFASMDETSPRGCIPTAETELAEARQSYDHFLGTIAPRLVALGIAADAPERAVGLLRARAQSKVERERRRLRDQYLQSQLVQHSRTVLAAGLDLDRLCWKAKNENDTGLRFQGALVWFNEKLLPDSVARQVWVLPRAGKVLQIPHRHAEKRDVLQPGAEFEACFYARGETLSRQTAESYGLAAVGPTRSGKWRVQWRDITLMTDSAGTRAQQDSSSTPALVQQLNEFEAGLEETNLIEEITRSAPASELEQAEETLLACHRAVESEQAYREVQRALEAAQEGRTDEPAAQARLLPILEQDLREAETLGEWIAKATALVNGSAVVRKESELGKPFDLAVPTPGRYVLLAEPWPREGKPKLWVLPVEVEEPVVRDLELSTARDMTLEAILEDVLLEPQRVPEL